MSILDIWICPPWPLQLLPHYRRIHLKRFWKLSFLLHSMETTPALPTSSPLWTSTIISSQWAFLLSVLPLSIYFLNDGQSDLSKIHIWSCPCPTKSSSWFSGEDTTYLVWQPRSFMTSYLFKVYPVSHSSPVEAGWTHQGKTCVQVSYTKQICPPKEELGIIMG